MFVPVQCEKCGQVLEVVEMDHDQLARCPVCRSLVRVPARAGATAVTAAPVPAPAPPASFPHVQGRGWQAIRTGILLVMIGALTVLAGSVVLLGLVGNIIAINVTAGPGVLLMLLDVPLFLAGGLVSLIGMVYCAGVPAATRLRGAAVAAALCCVILGPLGVPVFVLFLRRVAGQLGRPALARHLLLHALVQWSFPLLGCPLFLVFGTHPGTDGWPVNNEYAGAIQLMLYVGVMLTITWFIALLRVVRRSIVVQGPAVPDRASRL